MSSFSQKPPPVRHVVASGVTATGAQTAQRFRSGQKSWQASVTGTGAVTATVLIEVSNGEGWVTMGTITLSGTTTTSDGFSSDESWLLYRSNVTAISGTGATVSVSAGV